ncbi:MAG: hypothetical protein HYV28_08340 [Ignavibacteriales bacterium]|nr:hypothetical protein [Ignavibacteriales bacterium]
MKHIKLTSIIVFPLLLLICGCQWFVTKPEVQFRKDISGKSIAVLNFNTQGAMLPLSLGKYTADKLSEEFYFSGYSTVIERAKVNEAQYKLEIRSTEFLSIDNIQQLGLKLKAEYLVLGRIYQSGGADYIGTDSEKHITVSFRIVSVLNAEVAGIASYTCKSGDNPEQIIGTMIKKIIAGSRDDNP